MGTGVVATVALHDGLARNWRDSVDNIIKTGGGQGYEGGKNDCIKFDIAGLSLTQHWAGGLQGPVPRPAPEGEASGK